MVKGGSSEHPGKLAVDQTMAAPSAPLAAANSLPASVRSTVLPRVERKEGATRVVVEGRPRYEELGALGAGGQAMVTLTRDHDIDRAVALKRLLPARNDEASLLRFVEEIRTVGQLEHPNIVPIHDVGVDDKGRYFFVMKYVEGETLESIIAKLRAGDETYLARYTPEYRLQICNEVLRGVQHAHELGIVHRDLKPGNVMIGALGEVVVMDWGLAKRLADAKAAEATAAAGSASAGATTASAVNGDVAGDTVDERARLFTTHAGALVGTPAYMAPEQASGKLDQIDARSDVYSLAVMFYEFLCLQHPRRHCTSVAEMIAAVIDEPLTKSQVFADFLGVGAPAALGHFVAKGLARDPAQRYQTAAEMRARLEAVRDGKVPVQCHITFTQRALHDASHAVDRHPHVTTVLLSLAALGLVAGVVVLILALVR